jgi:hypothetical protein
MPHIHLGGVIAESRLKIGQPVVAQFTTVAEEQRFAHQAGIVQAAKKRCRNPGLS